MNPIEIQTAKICNWDDAKAIIDKWKNENEKIVFTNGCFDILHRGHVTYLAQAANEGSKLVIGLNDDDSVRRQQKSPERPINDELSRAIVLSSLMVVDLVVFFNEDTPLELIKFLEPNVLAKGADYDPNEKDPNAKKYIVGSDIMKSTGGKVVALPIVEGFSTTNLIAKINQK